MSSDPCPFAVVFEESAFRKAFVRWDPLLSKPLLEEGEMVHRLRVIMPAL